MSRIPAHLQDTIQKYKRWQDRHARLFAILLIVEGQKRMGFEGNVLANYEVGKSGRPYIKGAFDFSVSHSEEFVVCCVAEMGRVGVDLERIGEVDFSAFQPRMHPDTWKMIEGSTNSTRAFFETWTKVEAVLKADGRGLTVEPNEVRVLGGTAELGKTTWFLQKVELSPDFSCCVATATKTAEIVPGEIDFCRPITF